MRRITTIRLQWSTGGLWQHSAAWHVSLLPCEMEAHIGIDIRYPPAATLDRVPL